MNLMTRINAKITRIQNDRIDRRDRQRLADADERPARPVFVVGTGRSGTTLLGVMLRAHSKIAITPETRFFPKITDVLRNTRSLAGRLRVIEETVVAQDCDITSGTMRDRLAGQRRPSTRQVLESFYLSYAAKERKARWGDNTPTFLTEMNRIDDTFGGASFLHIVRDGRDVALSAIPLSWGPKDLPSAAKWWRETLERGEQQKQTLSSYHELRYEDLILSPRKTLDEVCTFLGEPFEEAMLDYESAGKARLSEMKSNVGQMSHTQRQASQERIAKAPDKSRVERWRREMTEAQNREFVSIAGDWLERFNYPLAAPASEASTDPVSAASEVQA